MRNTRKFIYGIMMQIVSSICIIYFLNDIQLKNTLEIVLSIFGTIVWAIIFARNVKRVESTL